jgi:hypothetical protein
MTIKRLRFSPVGLVVLVLFGGIVADAGVSEPARLGVAEIIQGVENNQKAWGGQKSWMVKYTHMRERIAPPPGKMVEFPDVELTNARRGKSIAIYHSQSLTDNRERKIQNWLLWDGTCYTERNGLAAFKQNQPAQHLMSYFWYPMTLMRDMISESIPIPEEAFTKDPELSLMLPHCLKANLKSYAVRKELEDVDGVLCHVLERPGKDVLWIAADHGFNVARRTVFQPSGAVLFEFKANGFKEHAKGIWLPKRQISVAFNFDTDPKEYRGRVRFVMINNLHDARFGDVPDSVFQVPLPEGVKLDDRRKGK